MKNAKIGRAVILFIGSTVVCAAVVLLFLFVPENPEDILGLGIAMSILAFTVIPAYSIAISKFKNADFEAGARLGAAYGFGLVILPLIFAPFFAVWFYMDSFFIR